MATDTLPQKTRQGVKGCDLRRLVVAVTVLSLALSPLWVVTGRRLHALAEEGITSGGELLRRVYGPETEFVADKLDRASSSTVRGLRAAALWLRRQRERRKRRAGTGTEPPDAARGEAEIILPGNPANDPGTDQPPPKPKARRKKRKGRGRA